MVGSDPWDTECSNFTKARWLKCMKSWTQFAALTITTAQKIMFYIKDLAIFNEEIVNGNFIFVKWKLFADLVEHYLVQWYQ